MSAIDRCLTARGQHNAGGPAHRPAASREPRRLRLRTSPSAAIRVVLLADHTTVSRYCIGYAVVRLLCAPADSARSRLGRCRDRCGSHQKDLPVRAMARRRGSWSRYGTGAHTWHVTVPTLPPFSRPRCLDRRGGVSCDACAVVERHERDLRPKERRRRAHGFSDRCDVAVNRAGYVRLATSAVK